MEENKTQGGGASRRPLGALPKAAPCCLPFVKDLLCLFVHFRGLDPQTMQRSALLAEDWMETV